MRRAAAASFVLVILATGCTGGGSHEGSAGPGSGSAEARALVLSATQVGPEPSTLVLGAGSLWVADDLGVERVDPDTGKVLAGLSVGAVGDVAAGDEGIWIIGYGSNTVGEVDPSSNAVTTTIALDRPTGIAVGEGAVWVASRPNGTVTRIDPGTGKVTATIVVNEAPPRFFPFAAGPTGIAVGDGAVWVADQQAGTLVRIDPTTNAVLERIQVEGGPASVAVTDGAVWVTSPKATAAVRIDPATNDVVAKVPLEAAPGGLTATDGAVWVAGFGGMLVRIDPATNRIVQRLSATDHLAGVLQVGPDVFAAAHALPFGDYYNPGALVLQIDPSKAGAKGDSVTPIRPSPGTLPVAIDRDVIFTPKFVCAIGASVQHCRPELDVYAPNDGTSLPVIVIAHGGPCGPGCRGYLDQQASALALDGAVVFNTDYRDDVGSVDDQTNDIACAVSFAREHANEYGGDGGRITLVGHSLGSIRGGTAALVGSASTKSCLASASGLPNAFVGLGGNPSIPTDLYGENPNLQVRLIIGTRDDPVHFANMKATVEALAQAGYDATFTPVPGANHYSAFEVGSGSPAFRMILQIARG